MCDVRVLKEDWKRTIGPLAENAVQVERWFHYLVRQYSAWDRKYHTLKHIDDMLGLAYENKSLVDNWLALFISIWFHDVVQNQSGQNEKLSARECLKAIVDLRLPESAMEAQELILATKNHDPDTSNDGRLLVDLDLAILGADAAKYQKYARHCRAEFNVPDWLYRLGRVRVLKRFLERKDIYNTRTFRERLEQKARRNLRWEIDNISKGVTL